MTSQTVTLRQRLRNTATEALLDSAERAMIRHGYKRATMQQIAAEAGCAAGTFYLYFKNKEVLFEAILGRHTESLFGAARQAMEEQTDPLEKLRDGLAAMIRYCQHHRPLFRLVFGALPMRLRGLQEKLGGKAQAMREEHNRLVLGLLEEAQKKGRIRKDLPAKTLRDFMEAVGFSFMEEFAFAPAKASAQEQAELVWGLMVGGIGARSHA